jgi:hypothetical protein
VKVHADREDLPAGVRPIVALSPFWGADAEADDDPTAGRYARWIEQGPARWTLTSLDDADVVLWPGRWEDTVGRPDAELAARHLLERANARGKASALFFWSDSDAPINVEATAVFRTSIVRSRCRPSEHAMPAWSEDFVAAHLSGRTVPRPYRERPVVGFCGYAPRRSLRELGRTARAALRREPAPGAGHRARARALAALSESGVIETNFVIRDAFFGGAVTAPDRAAAMHAARREYVGNMVESDYVLCARGNGNFSYRLYETLSCGRVPVFVDTDCVLPYEDDIPWRSLSVWVDEAEIDAVADRVADFHASLGADAFRDLQGECRRVWADRLSPEGFFGHLEQYFRP